MVLAKMPKIVLPASFEGESRVRRGLFLRYEQELTNEYPVQTRKEKYGFSKNNFRNQRKNGQKWSFLTVFQRLRSTFDPRQFSDAILSAFLAPISDGIYPFLGVLIPPDRNRGLRRLLSASVSFLSHQDEWGRPKGSRAGLHALDRPWNRRMEPLLLWLLPSLYLGYGIFLSFAVPEARLALCLGYIVDLPCAAVSAFRIYQAFLCS